MKKLLPIILSLFALAACTTTAGRPSPPPLSQGERGGKSLPSPAGGVTGGGAWPTPAEVTAKVCPSLIATIGVLQASPSVSAAAKEEIARGLPLVHRLCAPGAVADVTGLADLADITLPALMTAVSGSTLPDTDKNNLLLAIALLQIAVNTVKY